MDKRERMRGFLSLNMALSENQQFTDENIHDDVSPRRGGRSWCYEFGDDFRQSEDRAFDSSGRD
jgi:hypothetical protein